ncbi:helix-turn-helix transcriptional regulator [Streptomyces sp. NPDC048270]|uniref:helix-turn-helix domain-containing protein n=1 Tax=Streptomyces sp. NPDC048270 TaxID=3154615 RepID=UPI00341017AE
MTDALVTGPHDRTSGPDRGTPAAPAAPGHVPATSDEQALADAVRRRCAGPAGRVAIARALRNIRCRASLTQNQLAQEAAVCLSTVARYETWRDNGKLKSQIVLALARASRATAEEVDCLGKLVDMQLQGWWVGNAVPSHDVPLMSFEASGDEELLYAGGTVPDLLQTDAYAWELREGQPSSEDRNPGGHGQHPTRWLRTAALDKTPVHLQAILDEGALHRRVGSREAMAQQCEHLLLLAHRHNVEMRVLPFDAGVTPVGACGPFTVVSWKDTTHPSGRVGVVHQPRLGGGSYSDDSQVVGAYRRSFAQLRSLSLDKVASLHLISEARLRFA